MTPDKEKKFRASMNDLRFPFEDACEAVKGVIDASWRPKQVEGGRPLDEDEVREACGFETRGPDALWLQLAGARIKTFLEREERRLTASDRKAWLAFRRTIRDHEGQLQKVYAFKEPKIDCYDSDQIKAALTQTSWTRTRYRFGVAMTLDTFANVFGFNPKPGEPLARGKPAREEVRADASRASHGMEIHVGVGLGRSREAAKDPLSTYIAPAVSLSVTVASLSADPLYTDRKLKTLDGAFPPRLVVGVDAEAQFSLDPPEAQEMGLSSLKATLFADFLFSSSIGFRLGAPLRGELVTRAADMTQSPPVTERRALQWKVPVFIMSVIKM